MATFQAQMLKQFVDNVFQGRGDEVHIGNFYCLTKRLTLQIGLPKGRQKHQICISQDDTPPLNL